MELKRKIQYGWNWEGEYTMDGVEGKGKIEFTGMREKVSIEKKMEDINMHGVKMAGVK